MALVKVLLEDVLLACGVIRSMLVRVLHCTILVLELVDFMCMLVLQRMPSPLELGACIAVVDGGATKNGFLFNKNS